MAQTLAQIKSEITTPFMANATLIEIYQLTPGKTFEEEFSVVSLENILFNIFAYCIFSLQKLMDIFRAEIEARIAATRPHTKGWYRLKALDFQFGFELGESDVYDNTGVPDEAVQASKIVTNAAAVKSVVSGIRAIRMKTATTVNGVLAPLSEEQLNALDVYFDDYVGDAGTIVIPTSGPPDDLKLKLDIYYDPLVLGADGSRLDGTSATPIIEGITNYLKSIKFNGELVLTFLEQELKSVQGVVIPVIKSAASKFAAYSYTDGAENVGLINEIRVADAGYMVLDESVLEINYIPYSE